MAAVIGVSGKISSGKTTLASALSEAMNCSRASFGDYVRKLAKAKEETGERPSLQELGQSLVDQDCKQFCQDVIEASKWQPGDTLVVDGIRHVKVWKFLCELFTPQTTLLVVVETPDNVRSVRNQEKDNQNLAELDRHPVESDSQNSLPSIADLLLDGNDELDELVGKVRKLIVERDFL